MLPNATETDLNLIGDANAAGISYMSVHLAQIIRRINNLRIIQ
jgi:hypothetical protein